MTQARNVLLFFIGLQISCISVQRRGIRTVDIKYGQFQSTLMASPLPPEAEAFVCEYVSILGDSRGHDHLLPGRLLVARVHPSNGHDLRVEN